MKYFLLFLCELLILFRLSGKVHLSLSSLLLRLTGSKKLTIYIISALFFLGTVVHEMSHFLMALFTLVPVGGIKLFPSIDGNRVKLGSVSIGKTDPVRRFLISIAPFIIGTLLILILVNFLSTGFTGDLGLFEEEFSKADFIKLFLGSYFIFTVSNTMFMSEKDTEGVWGFVTILIILLILLVLFGVNFQFLFPLFISYEGIFKQASAFLLIPIFLDIMFLVFVRSK